MDLQYADTNASRCTAGALDAALLRSAERFLPTNPTEGQPRPLEPPM